MLAAKPHMTTIPTGFRALIELLVSQINGCRYCIALHTKEAASMGESEARISALKKNWRTSGQFAPSEVAAFAWAECVTCIETERAPEPVYETLNDHYSPFEIVDLTLIVAQMNAWNRLAISFEAPDA